MCATNYFFCSTKKKKKKSQRKHNELFIFSLFFNRWTVLLWHMIPNGKEALFFMKVIFDFYLFIFFFIDFFCWFCVYIFFFV